LVFGLCSRGSRKAEWREVKAVSVTITRDSGAENITGMVKVRKKEENENAGLLGAKGKRIGRNPVCVCGLFCDDVNELNG
jgi:hypothetical protein